MVCTVNYTNCLLLNSPVDLLGPSLVWFRLLSQDVMSRSGAASGVYDIEHEQTTYNTAAARCSCTSAIDILIATPLHSAPGTTSFGRCFCACLSGICRTYFHYVEILLWERETGCARICTFVCCWRWIASTIDCLQYLQLRLLQRLCVFFYADTDIMIMDYASMYAAVRVFVSWSNN